MNFIYYKEYWVLIKERRVRNEVLKSSYPADELLPGDFLVLNLMILKSFPNQINSMIPVPHSSFGGVLHTKPNTIFTTTSNGMDLLILSMYNAPRAVF